MRVKNTIFTLLITGFVFSLILNTPTHAQGMTTKEGMLTWRAQNFYPSDFNGKAPATKNSRIVVSFMVTENKKLANLNDYSFVWYIDGAFYRRGDTLSEISFRTSKSVGDYHFVRVIATKGSEKLESSIQIPIDEYSVVIEAPFVGGFVSSADAVTLRATPYFFNISSLSELTFAWKVQGNKQPPSNDNELKIIFESAPIRGSRIDAQVTAHNQTRELEFAVDTAALTIL